MAGAKSPKIIATLLVGGSHEAVLAAAAWLTEAMKQLVGVVGGGVPSKPGDPPHKQTGRGQESLGWGPTKEGAWIGYRDMGIAIAYGSYMAAHDSPEGVRGARRPSLSLWENYRTEMDRIIKSTMDAKMGS